MSYFIRKPCAVTEGLKLEILDLKSKNIVLCSENKVADQSFAVTAQLICLYFRIGKNLVF